MALNDQRDEIRDTLALLESVPMPDATSSGHWVYQSRWMWRLGPPVPLWMVDWFVTPLERFQAWRARHDDVDEEIPF